MSVSKVGENIFQMHLFYYPIYQISKLLNQMITNHNCTLLLGTLTNSIS